jgi:transcriptional regulator with XRE-family HTH domain
LQIAKEMDSESFQGTLHKYVNGRVPSPTQRTARKIADYFEVPIDAIYTKAAAEKVAAERAAAKFLPSAPGTAPAADAAESAGVYQMTKAPAHQLSNTLQLRIQALTPDQLRGLETVVGAYLDAVAPLSRAKRRSP